MLSSAGDHTVREGGGSNGRTALGALRSLRPSQRIESAPPPEPSRARPGRRGSPAPATCSVPAPSSELADEPTRQIDVADLLADDANDALYHRETLEGDELAAGVRVGRYSVLSRLGEGGMGVVYEAWDPQLDRRVALKVLRSSRPSVDGASPDEQLLAEAQTLARVDHPNIVTVYDAGATEERVFLAMELCRGQNLRQWLEESVHDVREILEVFVAAGRGLAAAHQAGVIHRDFKPANVLIGKDGTVRVADFGMSRLVAIAIDEASTLVSSEHDRSVSTIVGTPTYMAPEQLLGRLGDHRMDQFSFCLCLYWALLGHPPFSGRTFQERRRSVPLGLGAAERERLNRARRVPVRVRRALLRGLSIDPEARFPTMDALLAELVERRRWSWALSSLTLIAGLGLGVLVASADASPEPCNDPGAVLGEAWGPSAKQALGQAIERTGHASGAEQLEHAAGAFDRYAQSWKDAYSEACEATYVTRVQSDTAFDLRMRCLERRRAQLEMAVATVSQASDSEELDARMTVPFRLPALDECGDVAALESRSTPVDGLTRAQIDALVRRIDQADTMREAGLPQEGLAIAKAVVSDARELDHLPLLAQALESLGRLQVDGDAPQSAETTLREAITVGTRAHDDRTVARAWPSLVFALVVQSELSAGESLGFAAELAIERSDDETARGWLYNTLGALHSERGDNALALAYFQRALATKIQLRGEQDLDVGITWSNLGFVLGALGRWSEAADAFEQARTILAATVGSTHPLSDVVRGGLCRVETERNRYEVALSLCSEALERLEATSTSPVLVSRMQLQTAKARHGLGHREQALQLAAEARESMLGVNPLVVKEVDEWVGKVRDGTQAIVATAPAFGPVAGGSHLREGSRP